MLTAGTTSAERAITPPRKNTINEGLLYFLMMFPTTLRKI
jgi:hypothetical protein